jgi:hypothetical protein
MSSYRILPNSRADADNIYYTASIINNNTGTLGINPDPLAQFQEIRSVPILKDANDYEVSVLKVSLNGAGKTLPILIPQIQQDAILPTQFPPWNSTFAYRTAFFVQYGTSYYKSINAIAAGTAASPNSDPATDTSNWTAVPYSSFPAYSSSSTYTTGQYVVYGGLMYVAIASVPVYTYLSGPPPTGIDPTPPNATYWAPFTQAQVNQTIYSVTLNAVVWNTSTSALVYVTSDNVSTNSGVVTQTPTYVQWIPENVDPGTAVPTTAYPSQVDSQYYYNYSFNHWVVLVNSALKAAYTQLGANIRAISGLSSYTLQNPCPTVEYDEVNKLFSFYTSTTNTAWGNYTEAQPIYASLGPNGTAVFPSSGATTNEFLYVGYNLNFEGLMTNFDTQYYGEQDVVWNTAASGAAYSILSYAQGGTAQTVYLPGNTLVVRNKSGTNIINPLAASGAATTNPQYVTTQDFESTSTLWCPVGGIVLTTQLIPVRNEFTSAPVKLGSGNLNNTFSTAAFQTVLLDFTMDTMSAQDWRGMITFTPLAEFYPVSLTQSHQEIKSVDFIISWRNRLTNALVPLTLYNTATCSVRLLFRRKDV